MESGFRMSRIIFNILVMYLLIKTEAAGFFAETCTMGMMKANPAKVLPVGSSVTITCSLMKVVSCGHKPQSLKIVKSNTFNKSELKQVHETNSTSVNENNLSPPGTTYTCYTACDKLVCGIDIEVGMPPEQPRFVSCEQEGELGSIRCSWEKGRDTYIKTQYTLQLCQRMCMDNVTASEYGIQSMRLPVTVTRGSVYTAVVNASNDLGTNSSLPVIFTYFDAVKPHPPNPILLEFHNSSTICTVRFHDRQDTSHFRLRYRPVDDIAWQMVEILNTRTHNLTDLRPFTRYEFQVSCRFLTDKGKWSNWSPIVMEQTPEDVPNERLDIWYRLQDVNDKIQNITLFWKNMSLLQARGPIQYYEVVFHKGQQQVPSHRHRTTNTWYTGDIDKSSYVIAVSAHNSRGNSPPTYINLTAQDISAEARSNGSITVTWGSPVRSVMLTAEYVVEWGEQSQRNRTFKNWVKVPKSNRSTTISGDIKPYVCYEFRVYAVSEQRMGIPTKTTACSKQKAPLTGPEFYVEVQNDNVLVTWKEIPPEKQMGCIIKYNIYMQNLLSKSTTKIIIFSNQSLKNQHEIKSVQRNVNYNIWLTSSTEAGESTNALLQQIYPSLEGTFENYVKICVITTMLSALSLSCVCCFPPVRQKLRHALARILPLWCNKTVPDPANSTWAKEYTTHKDKMRLLPNQLPSTSSYDETETLEIEEVSGRDETQNFSGDHTSNVLQKEDLILQQKDAVVLSKWTLKSQERMVAPISDYLVNQDITVDYLPTNMSTGSTDGEEESSEDEHFPLRFFMPALFVAGGKLTLDAVKIDCLALAE
ncbi:interleukin-12 receptor subunit beta-2-like isoform X2 [Ascaphus truei]|uniref:interleukin-12 receptor subunit beta-2-like isoform X2 n=1 Tax=Ascaphus truei TaxID=8439 RepID=UPI003F5944C2